MPISISRETGVTTLIDDNHPDRQRVLLDGEVLEDVAAEFFGPAVAPVPQSVSPRQMRRALNAMNLRDAIEQYVATLPRDEQDDWEYGLTVERTSPIIETGRTLLGMSVDQVDDLFRLAETFI